MKAFTTILALMCAAAGASAATCKKNPMGPLSFPDVSFRPANNGLAGFVGGAITIGDTPFLTVGDTCVTVDWTTHCYEAGKGTLVPLPSGLSTSSPPLPVPSK